jgi:hypothetical protein
MPVNLLKQQSTQPVNLLREGRGDVSSEIPQTTIDKLRSHPLFNALIGAGYGAGEAVENVLKLVEKGRIKLGEISPIPEKYRFEQKPVSEAFPLTEKILPKPAPGISGTLGKVAGGAGIYSLFPAGRVAKGAGMLGRIGAELPRAAAFGATQMPEHPVIGAAIGAGTAPAAEIGLTLGAKGVAPLIHPLKATKNVIQRALKKGYTKDLYPFVEGQINNIRSSLRGSSSEETANRDVFNKMQRHYDELVGHGEDLHGNPITSENSEFITPDESFSGKYEQVRQMVPNLVINREPLTKEISKQLGTLNSKLQQFKESPIFASETQDLKNIVDNVGKVRLSNFEDLDVLKRAINERLRDRTISSAEKATLVPIKEAVREVLPASMEGRPEVRNLWKNIDKDYREQVIPFKEIKKNIKSPFIKAYHGGGENVDDLVKSYIKPGREDLMDNFLKTLPDDESRNIAAFDYLKQHGTKSTGDNPDAFIKQYSKLSQNQRKRLLPDHYEELNELEKLHKRMPIAFKAPKEIETETRGLSKLFQPKALLGFGGAGAIAHVPFSPLLIGAGLAGWGARAGFGKFAKSKAGKKLLMSELQKVTAPSLKSPLLQGLVRGGILSGVVGGGR